MLVLDAPSQVISNVAGLECCLALSSVGAPRHHVPGDPPPSDQKALETVKHVLVRQVSSLFSVIVQSGETGFGEALRIDCNDVRMYAAESIMASVAVLMAVL